MNRLRTYRATTEGIRVHVRSKFEQEFSRPADRKFIFSYRIIIENRSHQSIQVLKRKWQIVDALGHRRRVVGNGVVGVQPEILPGRVFEYDSACDLACGIGTMSGVYVVKPNRVFGKALPFEVTIPVFQLEAPWTMS
jgi:ApaG protein